MTRAKQTNLDAELHGRKRFSEESRQYTHATAHTAPTARPAGMYETPVPLYGSPSRQVSNRKIKQAVTGNESLPQRNMPEAENGVVRPTATTVSLAFCTHNGQRLFMDGTRARSSDTP